MGEGRVGQMAAASAVPQLSVASLVAGRREAPGWQH